MANTFLYKFIDAQKIYYPIALEELRAGKKRSHWMWFIFPQVKGLGFSTISRQYAIEDLEQAKAFLADPCLGGNLRKLCQVLLELETNDAHAVFGSPDDLKLRSSMTLFAYAAGGASIFHKVLEKYYGGVFDRRTEQILNLP